MIVLFRLIRELYILNEVFVVLQRKWSYTFVPQANVLPDKHMLVHLALWYFENITLMREVAYLFFQ